MLHCFLHRVVLKHGPYSGAIWHTYIIDHLWRVQNNCRRSSSDASQKLDSGAGAERRTRRRLDAGVLVRRARMAGRLVLFNGLELTDEAPGLVGRYRQLRSGAWQAARVLLYVYGSFPRLWSPSEASETGAFQYKWRSWVEALEQMAPDSGAWAALAAHLVSPLSPPTTHALVGDIARAVIELAMRDAEIERNALRPNPAQLPPYIAADARPAAGSADEQAFMSRIRSAAGYDPRVRRVEKRIYHALVAKNAAVVHAISETALPTSSVHEVLREGRF